MDSRMLLMLMQLLGSPTSLAVLLLSFFQGSVGVGAITFTFTNRCTDTVWPGVLSGSGTPPLETTGFALSPGGSRSLYAPSGWSGRFWARSGCDFDDSGKGSCATGDCGSGQVECRGAGASPPATLAEFTLNGADGKDFYDVSLVDGYNLPMLVQASAPDCPDTGCLVDLNERCPSELRADDGRACRSACEAFGRPEYCCNGAYGNPDTCHPSQYSQLFKSACPKSYSYAYDDATSTFTCNHTDYTITFCPRSTPSRFWAEIGDFDVEHELGKVKWEFKERIAQTEPRAARRCSVAGELEGQQWRRDGCNRGIMAGILSFPICLGNCSGDPACPAGASRIIQLVASEKDS
uniref:Thaumatin-like protein n=1 Tax=Oryza meridionalis TaxID=40149 RepID=A0A0E0ENQ3_9ORYZ